MVKILTASEGRCKRHGFDPWVGKIPGSRRFSGRGYGNPLQYSFLENPMDREPGRPQFKGSQRVRDD